MALDLQTFGILAAAAEAYIAWHVILDIDAVFRQLNLPFGELGDDTTAGARRDAFQAGLAAPSTIGLLASEGSPKRAQSDDAMCEEG